MDNNREVDSVLMNVRQTTGGIVSAMTFSARMSYKLVTFLLRLAKKGLLASGIADRFQDFHTKMGGDYTTYNIPLSQEKAQIVKEMNKLELALENEKNPFVKSNLRKQLDKMENEIPEIKQLKRLGITHCMLPKLNGSDNTIQIAVGKESDQHFKNWFLNHLTTEMKGGEKSLEVMKVFTEGNYSVLNMPFEKIEELGVMMSDFNSLGVNYSILPDLNVGDGYTQVAIPNSDRALVEQWFKMWKEKALADGKESKDMYSMDENSYSATGELSQDEFVEMADEQYQKVQAEFESMSTPVPWDAKFSSDKSPEFVKLMQDSNYDKITINIETLKENHQGNDVTRRFENEFGYFTSRVPGTYKNDEKTLVIPGSNVFTTDDDKTVIAFLDKRKDYFIISHDGTPQKYDVQNIKKIYDKVDRGFSKVTSLKATQDIAQNITKIPTPTIPTV